MPVEMLLWSEIGFVLHFLTVLYPIAKVEVRNVHDIAQFNLLQDTKSSKPAALLSSVEKRINGG